jgi:hypothetical protein
MQNAARWRKAFLPQQQPAELLFAGIAPGMFGIYQTAFRIPAGATPLTGIECTLASPSVAVRFGPGIATFGIPSGAFGGFGMGVPAGSGSPIPETWWAASFS